MAHMGISVSLGSTRNTIKSLRKHANKQLKGLPPGNMIYDNFDMDFQVAQPCGGHQGTHVSGTAATFAPYIGISPSDLHFTKELHETSRFNKDLPPNDAKIYKPTCDDILPPTEDSSQQSKLHSIQAAFAWHIHAILVEREPAFARYQQQLGLPNAIEVLPTRKTVQFPANAINADESQNDGNWEVLTSLLDQVCDMLKHGLPNY